ncbi:MAG: hypothetical protein ACRDNF_09175, partial [Streptosporangiaceae bacterium]
NYSVSGHVIMIVSTLHALRRNDHGGLAGWLGVEAVLGVVRDGEEWFSAEGSLQRALRRLIG